MLYLLLKTLFRGTKGICLFLVKLHFTWCSLWINISIWVFPFLLRSNELWHEAQKIKKWVLRGCHILCVLFSPCMTKLNSYLAIPAIWLWCSQRPLDITFTSIVAYLLLLFLLLLLFYPLYKGQFPLSLSPFSQEYFVDIWQDDNLRMYYPPAYYNIPVELTNIFLKFN